ncbi:MAG: hypothetical protein CMP27_04825 [Roseibacillus sp.]|nr:hypothetical protein [Roseibacillus sp.]|tara:strand:- start:2139 stop:2465 length:327 start_codon:yes stop_codon:yes gene_type:complete
MLGTSIGRLRVVSLLEGLSWIVLLYCSVVMKRMQGHEDAIYLPGIIHGHLFILLCLLLWLARKKAGWSYLQCAIIFAAALLPSGAFFVEPWLKREDRRVGAKARNLST